MVKGDADAVAAGHPAMVNPSAAELQAVLAATMTEAEDVAMADRAYDEAQEAVAALRSQADELIEDVIAELRFNLRKPVLSPSTLPSVLGPCTCRPGQVPEPWVLEPQDQGDQGLRTGQRRIMRTYGSRFRYLVGEPVGPDDEPATGEGEGGGAETP